MSLMSKLSAYSPIEKEGRVCITVPLVIYLNQSPLELEITESGNSYTVCIPNNLFEDANESAEFYFDIFKRHFDGYYYEMEQKNGIFQKTYNEEYSLLHAVNEFVRFAIILDDFMMKNDVVGNEENF